MLALTHDNKVAELKRAKTVTFNGERVAFHLSFGSKVDDVPSTPERKKKKKPLSIIRGQWDVGDFSGQHLTQFPLDIYDKPSLVRYLYLQDNQLTCLPEDLFCKLDNLEWVDIRNNRIDRLPPFKGHKRYRSQDARDMRLLRTM